jgi:hypothetical protein
MERARDAILATGGANAPVVERRVATVAILNISIYLLWED